MAKLDKLQLSPPQAKPRKKAPVNLTTVLKEKVEAEKFNYSEHWKEMPEFVQNDLTPIKTVYVHFADKEGMHRFSKLIGQAITAKTKSIWFPEVTEEPRLDKRWSEKKK